MYWSGRVCEWEASFLYCTALNRHVVCVNAVAKRHIKANSIMG